MSYFVCGTPRTGSSLLLGLLDSTGVCGHPQAYFRAPDEPLWAERWGTDNFPDFLRAARAAGSTPNGVFGAKLMWDTLHELVDKLATTHPDLAGDDLALLNKAFGHPEFIYVRRTDIVAQAVSWVRAEQTGTWFIGGRGEISGGQGNGRTPVYDAEAIGRILATIEEHDAAWEEWFATWGIQPHRVSYEQLDADLSGTTDEILEFLGLEAIGNAVVPRHRRQSDSLNQRWIQQFRGRFEPDQPDASAGPAAPQVAEV